MLPSIMNIKKNNQTQSSLESTTFRSCILVAGGLHVPSGTEESFSRPLTHAYTHACADSGIQSRLVPFALVTLWQELNLLP